MLRAWIAFVLATTVALAACIVPAAMTSGEHNVRAGSGAGVVEKPCAFAYAVDEVEDDTDDDLDEDELSHFVDGWILPRPTQREPIHFPARRRARRPTAALRTPNAPPLLAVFRPPIAA